jgi:hypothetical protein
MASRYGNNTDEQWLRYGSPSSPQARSLDQLELADAAALTTQVMTSVWVPWQTGDLITNVTFMSGATAAGTPTNWWFALYTAAGALLAQTADQTSTAWAADTVKTLALATAQRPSAAGGLYAAVMVKATTVPTLAGRVLGRAAFAGAVLGSPILAQTSGSALTTTAPATIASPTTVATIPFCVLS